MDLGRKRITARLARPEDLAGHHIEGLRAAALPSSPSAGQALHQVLTLTLPPAPADAVEAWLTGVLAPLAATIGAGITWAGPLDRHDAEPVRRLVAGLTGQAADALVALADAQAAAWGWGLGTGANVPQPWRPYTWCHARVSDLGEEQHGLLGGFNAVGQRYVRAPEGGGIRQWWPGAPAELARLLVETSPVWLRRPDRAHRNQDLAVLVWDRSDLVLEVRDIVDGQAPAPDAVARATVEPTTVP